MIRVIVQSILTISFLDFPVTFKRPIPYVLMQQYRCHTYSHGVYGIFTYGSKLSTVDRE